MLPKNTKKKKGAQTAFPVVDDAKLAGSASPTSSSWEADSGLTKALEAMTAHIAQMMNEKLVKMALGIKANISQSFKEFTDWVGKAGQRIVVVQNATVDTEKHLLALEKTVTQLRLLDYESRSRRKNLRIIDLP